MNMARRMLDIQKSDTLQVGKGIDELPEIFLSDEHVRGNNQSLQSFATLEFFVKLPVVVCDSEFKVFELRASAQDL